MTQETRKILKSSSVNGGRASVQSTTRVVSFTSGKGGVGKTHTVINFGMALASLGQSVLVLDADLGLANIDVMLGLHVSHTLEDVMNGTKRIDDVIIETPGGLSIIPASSGAEELCRLSSEQRLMLMSAIEEVAWKYDYLLIDTPAGIGSDVVFFNGASSEVICIISGEPTSLTDAYALIKILARKYGEKSISILVNNIPNQKQAERAFGRLQKAVAQFLQIELKYLGYIPSDSAVLDAVKNQESLLLEYPSSKAARAINGIARDFDANFHHKKVKGGMQFFFEQLLEVNSSERIAG